jgi:hypothetical protein
LADKAEFAGYAEEVQHNQLKVGSLAALACLCGPLACGGQVTDTVTRDAALVAQDMQVATPRDGTVTGTLRAQGGDPDTARYELVANGQRGAAVLLDPLTGTFSYTAAGGQLGFDAFTFRLHDGTRVSNVASVQVAITEDGVAGVLTYDFVPTRCDVFTCRLDYDQTEARPIRRAVVRLVDDSSQAVLSETLSDEAGRYLFARSSAPRVQVVVMAEMRDPPVVVRNNTGAGEPPYALVSGPIDVADGRIVNLNAPSGWDGRRYGAVRSAAPFAILDVAYRAAAAFAAVRPITFAPLVIAWSTDNRPEVGDSSRGQITTSHWSGEMLYLLGAADVDTDEYDTHVIAHEWGHYFEWTQSRADTPGGGHSFGDVLDMRVAFSEGWGNATSAMVLYPDSVYTDVSGTGQRSGFSFDLEDASGYDSQPGWFSEVSVQTLLYDAFDPATPSEPWDTLSLGLGPIYDVMAGPQRTGVAMTSVFTFVTGLKDLHADLAAALDALTAHARVSAVQDGFGTGEAHDASDPNNLPIYVGAAPGGTVTLGFRGNGDPDEDFNKLGSNRFVRFVGDGTPVNIVAASRGDVRVRLFAPDTVYSGINSLPVAAPTEAGTEYIVNVESLDPTPGSAPCTVRIVRN